MFMNYLKIAIRNLKKTKLFSLINILGLAIGMTACLLILHYVNFEKSYDSFHEDSHRIYRMRVERTTIDGTAARFASAPPPAAPLIRQRYPEVEKIARLVRYKAGISFGDIVFSEERVYHAEPQFLEILKFKLIEGDPIHGIRKANTAFISQSYAKKYFQDQNPIGKSIYVDKKTDYTITGIFEDIPPNSHLKFDILLSFKNWETYFGKQMENWGHTGFFTYMLLKPGTDVNALESKLKGLVDSEFGEALKAYKMTMALILQPLEDIHLTSHYMQEYEVNGNRDAVNFLFIIALFIIVIAWVNYVNLSTARSLERAREVGMRKVVGATRSQLMIQFFFETVLINLGGIILSLILVELFLPYFTRLTGTPASDSIWSTSWALPAVVILFLAGVVLSGLYPVAAMSSFEPVKVLKGKLGHAPRGISLRKIMVIFQFVMSLVLIAGTVTVYNQLSYMRSQDLGFNKEQIMVVKGPRARDDAFKDKMKLFKNILEQQSAVEKTCVATEVPGRQLYWDAGGIFKVGDDISKSKNYHIVGIDYDFNNVFGLKIIKGRNFSKKFPADEKSSLILNETAVKWLGFKSPADALQGKVNYWGNIYDVVGVMKNFHQQSPKKEYQPLIFRLMPQGRGIRMHFAVKLKSANIRESVQLVGHQYKKIFPGNPFDYFFLDDYFDQQYKSDELFGRVFGVFAFLAVFVTSLGIFGLSSFITLKRTKEIAVRKVLGATVSQVFFLLSRSFILLILVSFAIALPLAILGIDNWLDNFAYRMSINAWLFLIPLLIVSAITLMTTSAHVIRTATANPVDSLKYE